MTKCSNTETLRSSTERGGRKWLSYFGTKRLSSEIFYCDGFYTLEVLVVTLVVYLAFQ